jgi:hypothetical protein
MGNAERANETKRQNRGKVGTQRRCPKSNGGFTTEDNIVTKLPTVSDPRR